MVLSSNHNFTKLVIQHTHQKNLHAGVQETIFLASEWSNYSSRGNPEVRDRL